MAKPSSQGNGVPVSEAVSAIISGNSVMLESLKLKIVNYHGLAKRISSEVESVTGKKANLETIVVAIKRFSDGLPDDKSEEMSASLRGSKLNLAGSMVEMTVSAKAVKPHQILQDVLKLEPKFQGSPFVFQLTNSVKIIAENEDAKLLESMMLGRYETSLKRDVAMITIRLPPSVEQVPGIASFITELLYRNGVSIYDAFLSYEDVILIVQEKFGPKAYQALSEETTR